MTTAAPAGYVPASCAGCGKEFSISPPIAFYLAGTPEGHVKCPGCRLFLKVFFKIGDTGQPERAVTEPWAQWHARVTTAASEAVRAFGDAVGDVDGSR